MTLSLADLHKRAPEIVHLKPPVDPEKARAKVNRRIAQALHGQPDYDPFNALILIRAE